MNLSDSSLILFYGYTDQFEHDYITASSIFEIVLHVSVLLSFG